MWHLDRLAQWYSLLANELSSRALALWLSWLHGFSVRVELFCHSLLLLPSCWVTYQGNLLFSYLFIYLFIYLFLSLGWSVTGALGGLGVGGLGWGLVQQASQGFDLLEVRSWFKSPGTLGTWPPLAASALNILLTKPAWHLPGRILAISLFFRMDLAALGPYCQDLVIFSH